MENQIIAVEHRLAEKYGTTSQKFYETVKSICKMQNATNQQFEAFLLTAEKYNLNPLIKQMWAFPDKSGGIQTMVSADGWISIVNNQPTFDGFETCVELDNNGKPISATCKMYRKDLSRPIVKTVYFKEWVKESSPIWKTMPIHFLETRAYIQCARLAFNVSGVYDGENDGAIDVTNYSVSNNDSDALKKAIETSIVDNTETIKEEKPKRSRKKPEEVIEAEFNPVEFISETFHGIPPQDDDIDPEILAAGIL